MLPGEIRRYKQSSFPLLPALVGSGQTGQSRQASSFARLPGSGGQAGTRLPQIGNKVSLIAASQEHRNINVYQSKLSTKYAADTRRERAPDRYHTNRGKRSHGVVDSDLHRKAGPVGGQNSKPLSRQKGKRKHEHKLESTPSNTLDESERSSLQNLLVNDSNRPVPKRRHKSHVRESPYSADIVRKVEQRRKIKSCDRSSAKTSKSMLDAKDELKRHSREMKLNDTKISMKQKQSMTGNALDAKEDIAPDASKPPPTKRWKSVMVRLSKKSTPMWVGNIPAESWEEDCRKANNLTKQAKVNKKESGSERNVAKKADNMKSEAQKKTETLAPKIERPSKALHSTNLQIQKEPSKLYVGRKKEAEENRYQERTDLKQKEKIKVKQHTKKGKRLSATLDASEEQFSDGKVKRSKATERFKAEKSNSSADIRMKNTGSSQKGGASKTGHARNNHSQTVMHHDKVSPNTKGKTETAVTEKVERNHKMLKGKNADKNADKTKQKVCNVKYTHTHVEKVSPGRNEHPFVQKDVHHKDTKEIVFKEKKAYMKKTDKNDILTTKRHISRKMPVTSPQKTNQHRNSESRNSTTNTKSPTLDDITSPASLHGRPISKKSMNTKSDHKLNSKDSKTSILSGPAPPVATSPVSGRSTRPASVASIRTTYTPRRPASNASVERSSSKSVIQTTEKQALRKSQGAGKMGVSKTLERVTPMNGRSAKSRTATTSMSRASARTRTTFSRRSVASLEGRCTSQKSGNHLPGSPSSTSTITLGSGRSSSKSCPNTSRKQTFTRPKSECVRSLSISNNVSRIPVLVKSASCVSGRTATKSASSHFGKPIAAKPATPALRATSAKSITHASGRSTVAVSQVSGRSTVAVLQVSGRSTVAVSQVSGRSTVAVSQVSGRSTVAVSQVSKRSTVAKPQSSRPTSCKHDTPSCSRTVSKNDSCTSAKSKSSIPVPVRSARPNSQNLKRTILSSASRSRASSRSSLLSVGHVSVPLSSSPTRSCISKASVASANESIYTYDDDFEYESIENNSSEHSI